MQTSDAKPNKPSRWQRRLTGYRIVTLIFLVGIFVGVIGLFHPSKNLMDEMRSHASQPVVNVTTIEVTPDQANQMARAISFLESVGFNDPAYLGIVPGAEGEYPTFRATAIGGESIDLHLRTTRNGGWEIQPVGLFETVASADELARVAQQAVYDWENMSPDIQPRTDGAYGEYEINRYDYELLAPYNPDDSYWNTSRNETRGWPTQR